jgi:ribosomal protein L19
MLYFLLNTKLRNRKRDLINFRRKRKFILNNPINGKVFTRGDILTINFWSKTCSYNFEGICLGLKKKNLVSNNSTLILRNVLHNIGVELIISYYNYRLFCNTLMSDYKRKKFEYRSSKLYYLCYRKNQATKI